VHIEQCLSPTGSFFPEISEDLCGRWKTLSTGRGLNSYRSGVFGFMDRGCGSSFLPEERGRMRRLFTRYGHVLFGEEAEFENYPLT
jgi:hypothetical protein